MIILSPEASRYARGDCVINAYMVADRRKLLLAEVQKATDLGPAFAPERAALERRVAADVAADVANIAQMEADVARLERAVADEIEALAAFQLADGIAKNATPADFLAARDARDLAAHVLDLARAHRERCLVGGAMSPNLHEVVSPVVQSLIRAIAVQCASLKRGGSKQVDPLGQNAWATYLTISNDEMQTVPLFAHRYLQSSDPFREHSGYGLPKEEFVKAMGRFRIERENAIQNAERNLAADLAAAKARASVFGVAS